MTPDLAAWLASREGGRAVAAARDALAAHPGDALAAGAALRRALPDLPTEASAAAAGQAELHALALRRHGIDPDGLLLTRDGLEQATRPAVARRRARLLRDGGARRVLDLTGGLGLDARALVEAGLAVTAIEQDPATAVLLAHNCPQARVITGDSVALLADPEARAGLLGDLGPHDVVFADPARRDPAGPRDARLRARPERDPQRWSPPWSLLQHLDHPRVAVKAAPAFTPPPDWHAEWISVHRTVVECAAYSWAATAGPRQAVIVGADTDAVLVASDAPMPAPAAGVGGWLVDADPSVARAGALAALLARNPGLRPLGNGSTWLTADSPGDDEPFARAYPVLAELAGSVADQRRALDARGVEALAVRSADVGVAPAAVLRELRRREGNDLVLVATRASGRAVRYLCGPARRRSA